MMLICYADLLLCLNFTDLHQTVLLINMIKCCDTK